ncbi:DUF2591 domain-containing protein [Salmonella enterica subsp. enterica serovar Stanley]|nr:DUF2591 domain-containing protein [Salmonella enterica subsp. enterica serovar Stanley]EFT8513280.1 DUF2591 domain-containing protein [Salmonella enterica]
MKNYEEMSDFEINKAVALIVGATFNDDGEPVRFVECDAGAYADFNEIEFDPCNNPEDAEPIIIENRIGTIPAPDNGLWKAAHRKIGNDDTPYHFTQDKSPLRAAMIVFLKMNEDKL